MQQIGSNNSAHIGTYNDVNGDQINHHYIINGPDGSFLEQLNNRGGQTVLAPQFPPITRTFVTRKQPWEFINKTLLGPRLPEDDSGSRMLVVTGMGGCGKTQLMLKFMEVHKAQFARQFFIDGSSEDRIRDDIIRNVHAMGNEHSQKGFDECLHFLSRPSSDGVQLLLYDNVDDPDIKLSSLLPRGNSCAIAITSRNHLLGVRCPNAHLRLDIMSPDEAVELLCRSNPSIITEQDRNDAASVAEVLGCLPIALQQARSYMQATPCSACAYLERLSSSRQKLLGQAISFQMDMESISTYAAFETSLGRLEPRVQRYLRLLSYFHWSKFPLELIVLAAKHQFSEYHWTYVDHGVEFITGKNILEEIFLRDGQWDVTNLDDMTVALQNCSLMAVLHGVGTTLLSMHPLVHEWLQSSITWEEKASYQSAAVALLALGARNDYTASTQYLGSHVSHMSPLWNNLHVNNAAGFGYILYQNGMIQGALELQERVVTELRLRLDGGSIALSISIGILATIYSSSGRLKEAAKLEEEMLRLRKEILGERHPGTITASGNLANTYNDLGRLRDAEVLQEEVLRLRKEILGERHPDTIRASSGLASTYYSLGRLHDAEVLQEEVLRLSREILGERHPSTITASSNLAITYSDLGRLHDAEVLQEEVLRLRKEILGERHPSTISASSNLASTYYDLGRLHDAEVLEEEVLRLRKEILGERHPNTTAAMVNLAITYINRGRKEEALKLLNTAEGIIPETLGVAHPHYLKCQRLKSQAQKKRWYAKFTLRK